MHSPYQFYMSNGNYFQRFLERNPEFDSQDFIEYVIESNRADRDAGELQNIAKHEVLRLAYEYEEHMFRFPNCYGPPESRIPNKESK